MRDVTDNVTVDLPGMEQKRGRGRPRKAHAMTNAERQAAYRARRRAQQPADRSVTVTKMPADVDAYDECRLEVDQLREQLDEARREKDIAWRVMREKRDRAEELEREVLQLKKRLLQEKSVMPSNENLAEIEALRRQLVTCEGGRQEALRYAGALEEKVAAFESQQKSVTPSNGNPVSFDVMLDLLALAAKANTFEQRQKVRESELWRTSFVRPVAVSEAQMQAAGEAIYGDRKVVTRKA
ncbi:hypothetical protein [Ralstonia pseudosolanacearum]|uniref:hypothetical protein n=1 Tax=Ralstonia pseudosolanacearum TaxID=1310165 RepID=UPI001FF9DD9B|nr:hypothetical protein [Ralstonia pseudosolanacearum]